MALVATSLPNGRGYVRKQYHGTPPTPFKESLLDILPGLAGAYLSSAMRLKHLPLRDTQDSSRKRYCIV